VASKIGRRQVKAKRITVFNHKGGVGKTTLTMNIAAALTDLGRRVLLVDADPQCNLTSYLVADEVVDDLLDKADSAEGRTVWSALKPISEATGSVKSIEPYETGIPNLFILPGDIRLSEFETDLAEFWGQCLQRKMRGFRGTMALSSLVTELAADLKVDYVFFDSGPNIGPLNRVVVLDCDHLIVPVACDLFSLRALKTLGRTLVSWIQDWATIADLAPEDIELLPGRPQFLGYVPEGFRVYGGEMSKEYSKFRSRIEKEVHSQIVVLLSQIDHSLAPGRLRDLRLGEIKNFGVLVPSSQKDGLPLYETKAGSPAQRTAARDALFALAQRIDTKVFREA
jgi:cellulose biosynthesis protein BcsQ